MPDGNELPGLLVTTHHQSRRCRYIRVDTRDRQSGTPYNFMFNIGQDVNMDNVCEVHLHSVSIPNIANNISVAINNNTMLIDFTIAGLFTDVFPDGFYNTAQIISKLTTDINAFIAPSTIGITQDPITNKLTFTITAGPETFQIFNATLGGSTLSPTIGVTDESGLGVTTFTAQALPSLQGITYIYIHSPDIASRLTFLGSIGDNINVNGMFSIPVDVPYGQFQTYQPIDIDNVVLGSSGVPLRRFTIVLRVDQNNGRQYEELTDNFPVIIVLKFFYDRNES